MEFLVNGNPHEYRQFIENHSKGHFLQTLEWAEVKSDWGKLHFVIKDRGVIKGAGLILMRKVPLLGKNFLYCPRGPVMDFSDKPLLEFFIAKMKEVARQYNAFMLKIDPDIDIQEEDIAFSLVNQGFRQKTRNFNFEGIQPRFVSRLDITRNTDEILAGFHSKTRYNIRLAERKGVEVRLGEREDLALFQKIMEETGLRDRFVVRNLAYFQQMWDSMVPAGLMKLYLAEFEGKVLAGTISLLFAGKCWYLYGASSNSHRSVMPNYLLQWEMIRDAKEEGCSVYDFRGISGDMDPSNPLYGLYRFKKGFNGVTTEFIGEYDLVFDNVAYKLWDKGLPLLKKLRSKLILAKKAVKEGDKLGQVVGG